MEGDQGQGEGCRCDGGMFESPFTFSSAKCICACYCVVLTIKGSFQRHWS